MCGKQKIRKRDETMKLKLYLKEQRNMTYAQYRLLPDNDRWQIEYEFHSYNATLQRKKQLRENFIKSGGVVRQASPEELKEWSYRSEMEKQHRETSMKCGGVEGNGYIALHYRH